MINFKKMDQKDFVFVKEPISKEEEKEFSAFLISNKTKTLTAKIIKAGLLIITIFFSKKPLKNKLQLEYLAGIRKFHF
jgi:hypothetical protein